MCLCHCLVVSSKDTVLYLQLQVDSDKGDVKFVMVVLLEASLSTKSA